MDIERVLKEAKQDRFALIIPPEWEEFVNQHIAEIFLLQKLLEFWLTNMLRESLITAQIL